MPPVATVPFDMGVARPNTFDSTKARPHLAPRLELLPHLMRKELAGAPPRRARSGVRRLAVQQQGGVGHPGQQHSVQRPPSSRRDPFQDHRSLPSLRAEIPARQFPAEPVRRSCPWPALPASADGGVDETTQEITLEGVVSERGVKKMRLLIRWNRFNANQVLAMTRELIVHA